MHEFCESQADIFSTYHLKSFKPPFVGTLRYRIPAFWVQRSIPLEKMAAATFSSKCHWLILWSWWSYICCTFWEQRECNSAAVFLPFNSSIVPTALNVSHRCLNPLLPHHYSYKSPGICYFFGEKFYTSHKPSSSFLSC